MKWLLIGFYDKVNASLRVLSSVLKQEGQHAYCLFLKSDRSSVIERFRPDNKYYQYLFNGKLVGCGEDVNPVTDTEMDLLVKKAVEIDPDIVAVSCRSALFELSGQVRDRLQEVLKDVIYVVGGYGPTVEPERYAKAWDWVCVGEGEPFLRALTRRLTGRWNGESVPNALGEYRGPVPREMAPAEDLDSRWPDWDSDGKWLVEDDRVIPISEAVDEGVYDVFVSKGCLSTCTYCQANQWKSFYARYGAKYPKMRLRDLDNVMDELVKAKDKFPLRYVRFMDSIFGWNKGWLKEFLRRYKQEVTLPFFCYTDARWMDEERFKWLLDAGLVKSCVGIQSAHERIRREVMGRDITDGELREYARIVHDSGIDFQYDIIAWNPFDTEATLREGYEFIRTLPPARQVVACQLKMFPGSAITEMYKGKEQADIPIPVHDFYAWLYVMTLMGGNYAYSAQWFLRQWDAGSGQSLVVGGITDSMREAFQTIRAGDERKIRLNCDVAKGSRLSTLMFSFERSGESGAVDFDDRLKLQGLTAARDLGRGELLRWTDVHSSYGEKGVF